MIVTLQTERVQTWEQVRAFVEGSEAVDPRPRFRRHKLSRGRAFAGGDRESVYEFARRTLVRLSYEGLGKPDKGWSGAIGEGDGAVEGATDTADVASIGSRAYRGPAWWRCGAGVRAALIVKRSYPHIRA